MKVENYSNALAWLADLTQVNPTSRFYGVKYWMK